MNFLFPLLLLSSTASAEDTALKIKMELWINGTLVSKPQIVTLSGDTASIQSSKDGDGFFIEVTPTIQKENQVHMKFVVATIDNNVQTLLSEPQIISLLGTPAQITTKTELAKTFMSLTVTATQND